MQTDIEEFGLVAQTHAYNSVLRERIVEHVFVGDMLRRLWQLGNTEVEVLRSEFDRGGYDLVVAFGKIVRHIQFKSSLISSSTMEQSLSLRLAEKPSGCVVWVVVNPDLTFSHFLWFGGPPGYALPGVQELKVARQARANAQGFKAERPDHRRVPKGKFTRLESIDDVLVQLFGSLASAGTTAQS